MAPFTDGETKSKAAQQARLRRVSDPPLGIPDRTRVVLLIDLMIVPIDICLKVRFSIVVGEYPDRI